MNDGESGVAGTSIWSAAATTLKLTAIAIRLTWTECEQQKQSSTGDAGEGAGLAASSATLAWLRASPVESTAHKLTLAKSAAVQTRSRTTASCRRRECLSRITAAAYHGRASVIVPRLAASSR